MKLYFENANGQAREIATCASEDEVMVEIKKFIDNCNKGRTKKNQFKSYYTRIWNDDGKTWYDVGSHTEFFYVCPEIKR